VALLKSSTNFFVRAPKLFSFREPFFFTAVTTGLGLAMLAPRLRFKEASIEIKKCIGRVKG